MSPELEKLIAQWKKEKGYRDMGAAAAKTWKKIREIGKPAELLKMIEEEFHLNGYPKQD